MKKKMISLLIAAMFMVSMVGCAGGEEPVAENPVDEAGVETLKVGVLFPGSIGDSAWNEAGYDALVQAKEDLGIEFSFQESVPVAESAEVMRSFAYEGYDLIIAHDFNYNDIVAEVAPEFPDVMFSVSYGYQSSGDNVVAITSSGWQFSYMAGVLAGSVSESGSVGVLTATDSFMGKRMRAGYVAGAKSVNPEIEVLEAFTGSWDDVVKGKELVNGMIQQGIDVIFASSGNVNVGVVETAREAGIMAIGSPSDMTAVAPDTVIASAVTPSGIYVDYAVREMAAGTLKAGVYVLGIKEGAEALIWNPAFEAEFPSEVIDAVQMAEQKLSNGEVEEPVVE